MHQKKCMQSKLISLLSPIVLNFTLSIFQAPFLTGLPKHDAARQITNNAYPRNRVRKVNSKPVIFSCNPASYPYKQLEIGHSTWIQTTAINAEQKH